MEINLTTDNHLNHVLKGEVAGNILVTLDTLIIFPIVIGNVCVLIAYLKCPKLRSPVNLLVINLAIVDILTGLIHIPVYLFSLFGPNGSYSKPQPCIFMIGISALLMCETGFMITCIGLVRCLSVCFPFKTTDWFTMRKIKITILFGWIYFFAVGPAYIFWFNTFSDHMKCDPSLVLPKAYALFYCSHFIIEALFSTGFYIIFIRSIFKSRKRIKDCLDYATKRDNLERSKTIMTIVVLTSFYGCVLPFGIQMIISIIIDAEEQSYISNVIEHSTMFIMFSNSMFNPIIYAGFNMTFRNQMLAIFKKDRKQSFIVTTH